MSKELFSFYLTTRFDVFAAVYFDSCQLFNNKDKGKMGQSMDSPKRANVRNHPSRYSARSLQRSSRKSLLLEKRNSFSASKIQQNQNN